MHKVTETHMTPAVPVGSPGSLTALQTAANGTVRKRFHKELSAGDTVGMEDGRWQKAVAGSLTETRL